jgi:histidine ammonia-lyase
VRSHAVGVGEPLPFKTVKKMTILRINTLAKGRSGIRPDNLMKIIKLYNANFIPMIP